jgi:hypothetical protein
MGKHELDNRQYGCRYHETRDITELGDLAERILADLPPAGTEKIPDGTQFGLHVMADVLLHLQVGGMADGFSFADRTTRRYSDQAIDLINYLGRRVESYNWTNPSDPTDRRFVSSVYLWAESGFRSIFWVPGVLRIA